MIKDSIESCPNVPNLSIKGAVFVATSLDGYIARADGGLDWLPPANSEPNGFDEFIETVDAHVIGRFTYEMVLGFGSWPYGTKPVFVLSTGTIAKSPNSAIVEQLTGSPKEIMSMLDKQGFRNVWVDGGVTVQRFLRQGMIHRFIITRVPVLIGNGIPLFGSTSADVPLKHVRTIVFANGSMVQSEYELE